MLGLDVLQVSWPVGGWVHRFFASTMDRLQGRLGGGRRAATASSSGGQVRGSTHDLAAATTATTITAPTNFRPVQHVDPLQAPLSNTSVQARSPAASVVSSAHPTMGAGYPAYSLVYMADKPFGADINGGSSNPQNWQLMPPSSGAALSGDFMHDVFLFQDTGDGDPPLQLADFLSPLQSFS